MEWDPTATREAGYFPSLFPCGKLHSCWFSALAFYTNHLGSFPSLQTQAALKPNQFNLSRHVTQAGMVFHALVSSGPLWPGTGGSCSRSSYQIKARNRSPSMCTPRGSPAALFWVESTIVSLS